MNLQEHLVKSVRSASIFNPEIQVAPACILWPDRDRQWETVIPLLQGDLPELFVFGEHLLEKKSGPAIWLRCAVAGEVEGVVIPEGRTPILYLPGVSRQDLRAIESCPDELKPLAELQYRGVIWSQVSAKDWTILAYLKSDQGGLGLDVAQDSDAKSSMQLALYRLLDEDVERLKGKRLDKDYFNTLLTGGDPTRDLLHWLDQGDAFQYPRESNEWKAFVEVCKSQFGFNPEKDGAIIAAEKLANASGPWKSAWDRFCEAPQRYSNIPDQLRSCRMPPADLLSDAVSHGNWPQWNEGQEHELADDLKALVLTSEGEAAKRIRDLAQKHSGRLATVWQSLGQTVLAESADALRDMISLIETHTPGGKLEDLEAAYWSGAWQVDHAVLRAFRVVLTQVEVDAVTAAVQTVYRPWLEKWARCLQNLVHGKDYPRKPRSGKTEYNPGTCVVFVDGLRLDLAHALCKRVAPRCGDVKMEPVWSPLPSITPTAKPATSPVIDAITGKDVSKDFEPVVAETGQSLRGGYHLKKLLDSAGWQVLTSGETGDPTGYAWTESGIIDKEGHHGWKLARYLDNILREIEDRITQLLDAGWKSICVVTDHGFIFLPGGLPEIYLPKFLTDNKWGRCAAIKDGAATDESFYPWFWNPTQQFALAEGISCYKKAHEYTHGGLTVQECLVQRIWFTGCSGSAAGANRISEVAWRGLRCRIETSSSESGLTVDLRTAPGDPSSSLIRVAKPVDADGYSSVVVADDDLEHSKAWVVLLASDGSISDQQETVVGGD